MPGSPGAPPPSAECQRLLAYRDEARKHGDALQAAGRKKAPPEELCTLFKAFLGSETEMVKGLEQHAQTCGVLPDVLKQVRASHTKAEEMGNRICDVAMMGRPRRLLAPVPSCSEKGLIEGVPCLK